MPEETGPLSSVDPMEPWKQWYDMSSRLWSNLLDGGKETYVDPYGLYRSWLKGVGDAQEQMKAGVNGVMDPKEMWMQWTQATTGTWRNALKTGGDPLGLTTQWLEMTEEAQARIMAGAGVPADPFTVFKEWYDATSEVWARVVGDVIGAEKFIEVTSGFLESYTSFYRTFRRANEEYFRNLQLPTRSDMARVAQLVVNLEEKVDAIEDAFEDFEASSLKSEALAPLEGRLERVESKLDAIPATLEKSEAVANLAKRLGQVESKLDTVPAALEKSEAVVELAKRLGQVESKLDTILAALEKIEVREQAVSVKPSNTARRRPQEKNVNSQKGQDSEAE